MTDESRPGSTENRQRDSGSDSSATEGSRTRSAEIPSGDASSPAPDQQFAPAAPYGHSGTPIPRAVITEDWLSRLLVPAYEAKGWLKFLGVVSIVVGAVQVLSIVGILIAWLYIWLGVLLWQAGDRAGQATLLRDPAMLEQYLQKAKTVFVIAGVTTAVGIAMSVLAMGMILTFGWMAAVLDRIPSF